MSVYSNALRCQRGRDFPGRTLQWTHRPAASAHTSCSKRSRAGCRVHLRQSGHHRAAAHGRADRPPDHPLRPGASGSLRGGDGRRLCAQASGKPGFINLHTAGGLGHGLGNLLNACTSGTPLVVTAGQQDSRHAISDPLLQGDLVAIATPVAKWAMEVSTPEQIPILIRRAFQDSHATPSGPVFLSLPMNVMEAERGRDPKVSRVDRRPVASSRPNWRKSWRPTHRARWRSLRATRSRCTTPARRWWNSPSPSPRRYSARPGQPTFPTPPATTCGRATCPPGGGDRRSDLGCRLRVRALGGKSFITILHRHFGAAAPAASSTSSRWTATTWPHLPDQALGGR